MIIVDKTSIAAKTMGILCGICSLLGLFLTFKGFVLLRFVVAVANAMIAFVCIKGIGADQEIFSAIWGVLAIYDFIHTFFGNGLTLRCGLSLLLRIACYLAVLAYFFQIIHHKLFPIIGGSIIAFLPAKSVYSLILSFQSLSTIQTTVGTLNMMPTLTSPLVQTFIFNILGVATYVFPAFSCVVLIAAGAIKFTN